MKQQEGNCVRQEQYVSEGLCDAVTGRAGAGVGSPPSRSQLFVSVAVVLTAGKKSSKAWMKVKLNDFTTTQRLCEDGIFVQKPQ